MDKLSSKIMCAEDTIVSATSVEHLGTHHALQLILDLDGDSVRATRSEEEEEDVDDGSLHRLGPAVAFGGVDAHAPELTHVYRYVATLQLDQQLPSGTTGAQNTVDA
eukprot:SAG31_NODE_5_length_43735_cov_42.922266_30_plen_107_part_00